MTRILRHIAAMTGTVILLGQLVGPTARAQDLRSELNRLQTQLQAMGDRVISESQWAQLIGDLDALAARARSAGEGQIEVLAVVAQARAWGELRRDPSRAVSLVRSARARHGSKPWPEVRQLYLTEAEMLSKLGDADAIRRLMTEYRVSPVYDPPAFAYTATPDPAPVVAMVRPRSPQTESPVMLAMQKYLDAALAAPGARMPDFLLTDIDGLQYSPGSMRGRVVLIDVWVAGSVPYEREIPFRVRTRQRFAAQGFEILGICQNLDAAAIRQYIAQRPGMAWPQVEGRTARSLIIRLGIPGENASFLLDREGRIRARNLTGAALADAVARLLTESP